MAESQIGHKASRTAASGRRLRFRRTHVGGATGRKQVAPSTYR